MQKIYFAGPLFSKSEKDFNLMLARLLEKAGYQVFLPQRDGFEAAKLHDKTEREKMRLIFEKDVSEILSSDIFFMVLDGRIPDEGACVELGIAYASCKRCYGIKTDSRSIELGMDLNPLIAGCFQKIFYNLDWAVLEKELCSFLENNAL